MVMSLNDLPPRTALVKIARDFHGRGWMAGIAGNLSVREDLAFSSGAVEVDYINVPANVEHWFEMKDSKRIKAVRYFIDTSGWTPVYTERKVI